MRFCVYECYYMVINIKYSLEMLTRNDSFYIFVNKNKKLMTKDQFPIRLHEARLMMKLSMDKLVELTGGVVTKQSISRYEKGIMRPKQNALIALAKALHISEEYFSGTNLNIDMPMLRTTSNGVLTDPQLLSLEAKLSFWAEQYLAKERAAGFTSSFENPLLGTQVSTLDDVIQAADLLREKWHCGDGPIASILRLLERKGIKIMEAELPEGVFGLSTWADSKHPLIVLDFRPSKTTVEKLRYTSIHELAHLLLSFPKESELGLEKRCDMFASYFLIPKHTFIEELGESSRNSLSLEEMIDIKEVYGISLAALSITARDYGIVSTEYKRSWYDKYIKGNTWEIGLGHYAYPENIGKEKRIESRINNEAK